MDSGDHSHQNQSQINTTFEKEDKFPLILTNNDNEAKIDVKFVEPLSPESKLDYRTKKRVEEAKAKARPGKEIQEIHNFMTLALTFLFVFFCRIKRKNSLESSRTFFTF
jgi:hypothetical protein